MLCENITLSDVFDFVPESTTGGVLHSYCRRTETGVRTEKRGAVIVLHGGGYFMRSMAEYEAVALRYLAAGYQAFTLDYSLLPAEHPQQLLELAGAVAYVRANAGKYNIDPDCIALSGFSAGSHLAALLANKAHEDSFISLTGLSARDIRPNAVILAYPPTTFDSPADCREMFKNLMGGSDEDSVLAQISPLHGVTGENAPAFIWHTFSDEMVDVRHSLYYAQRLKEAGVKFELHIFPEGPHAMGLCDEETAFTPIHLNSHAGQWFPLALNWLKVTFGR